MPQRRHPSPAGENEKIAVRAVRHRVRLKGAPGEAVYAAYLLRPRACPQRRSDSLQVAKHVFERGSLAFTLSLQALCPSPAAR